MRTQRQWTERAEGSLPRADRVAACCIHGCRLALRRAATLKWKLDVDLPAATEQVVRMGANKGGRLLERVLHRPGPDAALAEAVVIAEELNDDGVVCV